MKLKHRRNWTNKIYDNCRVLSPDGQLMHLARRRQLDWYVEKGLAEFVEDDPPTIRLKFQPNGLGHAEHEFYLTPRENKCVVCGATEKLTRHHVVPSCYWHHVPKRYKSGSSHDVVCTCRSCHIEYEYDFSQPLKLRLADKYNAPIHGIGWYVDSFIHEVRGASRTLKKHEDKLPLHVKEKLWEKLETHFGKEREAITRQDMEEARNAQPFIRTKDFAPHGLMVIRQIEDIWEFTKMWRQHFIDSMNPQHMPQGWSITHKVRHSGEPK